MPRQREQTLTTNGTILVFEDLDARRRRRRDVGVRHEAVGDADRLDGELRRRRHARRRCQYRHHAEAKALAAAAGFAAMASSVIDFRLVRLRLDILSMVFAVRLRHDLRGLGRNALRARPRQGERGDRKGHKCDESGPQAIHSGHDYAIATLKVK